MSLWERCNGAQHIKAIKGSLYRLVESQEHIATLDYVDSLEEQALLEQLLEDTKPDYPDDTEAYHYLLKTPFRYPPLPWGSRFGRTHEPSLFYGASSQDTVLAESAYYRFVFWYSMETESENAPDNKIRTEHTLFSTSYQTSQGIKLQHAPFDEHSAELRHPQHYTNCQLLGSSMREANVEGFEYLSARDPDQGICVALFSINALNKKRPKNKDQWLCELSGSEVTFKAVDSTTLNHYRVEDFYYQGELPFPA